jgi:hypothetical protein
MVREIGLGVVLALLTVGALWALSQPTARLGSVSGILGEPVSLTPASGEPSHFREPHPDQATTP